MSQVEESLLASVDRLSDNLLRSRFARKQHLTTAQAPDACCHFAAARLPSAICMRLRFVRLSKAHGSSEFCNSSEDYTCVMAPCIAFKIHHQSTFMYKESSLLTFHKLSFEAKRSERGAERLCTVKQVPHMFMTLVSRNSP
eukprot:gnl/TRDRNA2_/TRDRNA2_91229_c0_seq1.p2 gnl/TRDRNA2_/TRDRNA2_91229_c0~~gnl/TRDRNA2_/TRDRNA2_91229_c0_seq1.p2  ORF type:complete len:141 (+),score=12.88 gnl/TRDRNA2_/TRDRNA2_91229_c0_seq1:886-1308(+)